MTKIINPGEFEPTQKIKFTKTELEYNMNSIRFLLLAITAMFILIGSLMIVLGISVYSYYHNFTLFYDTSSGSRFFTPSIMTVIIGIIMIVVTSFGFYGGLKKSTCMVNTYAVLLTMFMIIKLVIVILAFTVDTQTLMSYIHIPISQYGIEPEIRSEIDALQIGLNCCGNDDYMDYYGMQFPDDHTVNYKLNDTDIPSITIPMSCCSAADGNTCVRIRIRGCKESVARAITQNSNVIGVMGVSVMFIQFLGIVFALLLAHCIRKVKSERALIEWRLKEQMILARQEVENNGTVYIDRTDSSVA